MKGHRDWMLIVFAALTIAYVQVQAQQSVATSSTYGGEFFIGFLPTVGGSSFATVRLTIGTPATMASFVVQTFDQIIEEGNVTSSSPVVVSVPMDLIVTGNDFNNRRKGIRVTAVGSSQLFVLAETFVSSLIHGTFLAYPDPRESLGDVDIEYEYVIVSTDDPGITNSVFLLVGCDDNTTFTVVPSQRVELPSNLQTSSFAPVSVNQDMRSHQLTLHQMQTLLVSHSSLDLTGTRVISNKPLTVISGHECANIPQDASGCEPLAVQIPPVATWGTEFLLAPFAGRSSPQVFKIVASSDTSSLTISCGDSPPAVALTQNSVYTLATSNYCHIESVSPVFVIQLATGSTTDGLGDPAIAIVSPIDQYINNIEFISLPTSVFPSNYISILVPTENYDPNSILLDDRVLSCQWQEIYNLSRSIVGYGCNMTITSGTAAAIQHNITYTIPGGQLSVTAYGFNTPPRAAGYAYLTGQQLKITEVTDPGDIVFEIDSLPLFDLETFPGVMELSREEIDPISDPIIIDRGLVFGNDIVTTAQVNENGVISFNGPWRFSYPERFPTNYYWTRNGLAVAPFWSDNDIRRSGAVRYAVYSSSEGASNQQGREILDQVNSYIQARQPEGEEVFTGRWILIAHWDHVHPSPHGDDDHRGIPEEELERTNNYQAIVVTNNTRTFVIYTYTCGEIQWSALGRNRAAVVGYNARGDYYSNHPSSGFSAIGNSVSCTFQLGRRQARQAPPPSMNLMMDLGTSNSVVEQRGECLNAINTDIAFLTGNTPQDLINMLDLDTCPCNLRQVRNDFGRFILQPGDFPSSVCYVSATSISVPLLLDRISLTQQCCYNENTGALQTSANDMHPGTMLLYHPIYDSPGYQLRDKDLRDACCGVDGFCQDVDFFSRRPIINCDNYSPPSSCIGWGDPHYTTFDGRPFDFQDTGDFVLVEVLPVSGQMSPVFILHGQMDDSTTWTGATTHRGLAFGRPDLAFHVGMFPGLRIFQTKPQGNSREITLHNGESFTSPSTNPWPEVLLTRRSNQLHIAFYDIDIALIISAHERPTEYNVDFEIRVPQTFQQKTRGFCGNLDSDDTNEFYRRSGTTLILQPESDTSRLTHEQLYSNPFQSWRIGSSESSFDNTNLLYQPSNRGKRQTVQNDTFMPVFFDELNFTTEQRMICEDNPQCLFDLVVTGELEIAMNTLQLEKEANATKESFENTPPVILADSVFRVNLGEESIYSLSVSDPDGDNFTLTLMNDLPDDPKLEQTEEEYLFVWTLLEITNVTLTFVATDSKGAATIFSPTVELCACVNNGNCTRDGLLVNSPTIVMNCRCSEAFSGAFCEEDRDGCTEMQCFEGVECRDVPAPGVGAVCGACPEGYTGDEVKCYDIDECSQNETNNCDQLCINTDGSFVCACMEGYEFIEETNQCEDINECDQVNDCHQECQNTVGSFVCSCIEGFILAEDGKNCTANRVCAETNICSDICANINGEEKCFCPIGFQLSTPGGSQCDDVDECQGTTPCGQLCMNTDGSYECGCTSGYELQQDEQTCEDIDECLEAAISSIDLCEDVENSQCVNVIGSYNCSCVSGYEMISGLCERIQEVVPPPSPIVSPDVVIENSLNFTTSALTFSTFTPDVQQMFREVTAIVVNEYCSVINCTVISRVEATREIADLQIGPPNIAIPTSLITQVDAQLTWTFYVQMMDVFLIREDLLEAVQLGEDRYRSAGLLPTLVTTTAIPSEVPTQSSTEFEVTSATPLTTQTTTATTAIPSEVPTQPSTEFEVTTPLTTQTPTDPPQGIPFCDCGRHVECTVEGKFLMDGNVRLIVGTQMKCSVQLESTVATAIRDQANIDGTFDRNFLSPGSILFLKHLGVIVEAQENMQPCNISSFTQHQNPGIVFQELGVVGLSFSYLKEDGAFDSLYMSTDELQAIDFNSGIFNRLAEDLGSENACSFQSLLYYLTTGLQYLLETAVCRVFTSEDAVIVVNFTAYCG